TLSSWLFMMPSLFIIGVFLLYPLVNSIYLSFTNYNFVYSSKPEFIGFNNFKNLFLDLDFVTALKNTFHYTLVFFPLMILFSFLLALLLNSKTRGTGFFQSAILLPMVVPLSLAGVAFTWILAEDFGILNHLLANILKLPQFTHFWLAEKGTALNSLAAVGLWKYVGFCVVLFLSGLKSIPGDIYEAARVDGVNSLQQLIYITIPNLRSSFLLVSIWSIIQALKVYDQVVVMTNGGPGNLTLVLYLYAWKNAFEFFNMGYAQAIALFIAVLAFTISFIFNIILKPERK
ncbi:MAG: sugar ABC transporter permease, partial [Atribacterales bacterium]